MKTLSLSILLLASFALASACRKKEKNHSDAPIAGMETAPEQTGPGEEANTPEKVVEENGKEAEEDLLADLPPPQAGALALALTAPNISFVEADPDANAARGFSLLTSDFDSAYEYKYRWDPAQAPLKSLNNNLQVVSKTGYAAFIGKGKRLAKLKLGDIFGKGDQGTAGLGGEEKGGGKADTPVDVVFEAVKDAAGKVTVKIWFTRTIDSQDHEFWQYKSGDSTATEIDLNYYAMVTIHKNSRQVPPYGVFDFIYEMRPVIKGDEADNTAVQGYVIVSDDDGQVSVKYRERSASRYTYATMADGGGGTIGNEEMVDDSTSADGMDTGDSSGGEPVAGDVYAAETVGDTATWEYSTTQLATALLSTTEKKVVAGQARTASQYASKLISGSDPNGYAGWSDQSGSYSLAFHRKDGLTPTASAEKRGASVTQWAPDGSWYNAENYGAFDPTSPRCEEIGSEIPSTSSYGLYDAATGAKIPHKTYLGLFKEGDANWAGCWLSRWGSSCYGDIESGDTLKSYEGDSYTVELMAGSLIDASDSWDDITQSTESDLTLTCAYQCPKANITQADLNSQYSESSTMYLPDNTVYTFNATDKTLVYGGTNTVGFSGDDIQWGWISVSLTDSEGKQYQYQMSTDNKPAIAKDSNGNVFVPAEPIKFMNTPFDASKFVRDQSVYGEFSMLHDVTASDYGGMQGGETMYESGATEMQAEPLQMENGWMNIGWFQSDLVDQWGWNRQLPNVSFKKGAVLTVESDPDGKGPIVAGQKVKLAPLFTETIPRMRSSNDCQQSLLDKAAQATEATMPLPTALAGDANNVRLKIGAKPVGTFPVVNVDGEIVSVD